MVRICILLDMPVSLLEFFSAETQGEPGAQEIRNERALFVFHRVQHKLTGLSFPELLSLDINFTHTGRDFNPDKPLSIQDQVEKLIDSATALENLCQCFSGWCAFW
jgi:FKBP12-rapamycin complex-associated protein